MGLNHILVAATAISLLLASPSFAASNFSNVTQDGNDNSGLVVQDDGVGNKVGTTGLAARQHGNRNVLTLTQSGSNNEIGTGVAGFLQSSNRNVATITQSSSGNKVLEVKQAGIGDYVFDAFPNRNTLTITQRGGNGNIVTAATQVRLTPWAAIDNIAGNIAALDFDGSANGVGVFDARLAAVPGSSSQGWVLQRGAANELTFMVKGNSNLFGFRQVGLANAIESTVTGNSNQLYIRQGLVSGNLADVTLTGDSNLVGVTQDGLINTAKLAIAGSSNLVNVAQLGANSLTLDIWGDDNNSGTSFTTGRPAALAAGSLQPGTVWQDGAGNSIVYALGTSPLNAMKSNDNQFAFSQTGNLNTIVGSTSGHNNEVAIVQTGNRNFTSFVQIGNGNSIGVTQ